MASRDLTLTYSRCRNSIQSRTALSVPLLSDPSPSASGPSASASGPSAPPHPVAIRLTALTQKQVEFDKKINELAYITFDEKQNELNKTNAREIYNEINRDLRVIKDVINQLPESDKISVSLKRKFSIELQENITVFKEQQKKYKTLVEMYTGNVNASFPSLTSGKDESTAVAIAVAVAEAEAEAEAEADERLTEIIKLAHDVHELAKLFNELSDIVIHQGTLLDRIDHNMDTAIVHIDRGKTTLATAQKYQQIPHP
jgi:syntaxin 16